MGQCFAVSLSQATSIEGDADTQVSSPVLTVTETTLEKDDDEEKEVVDDEFPDQT